MIHIDSNAASAPRSQETAEFDVALATCKFCGTVAHPDDEKNCASLEEAYRQTPTRPYGCPWFTKEDRVRAEKPPHITAAHLALADALERNKRLEADLNECREFIEAYVDTVDSDDGPAPNRAMTLVCMIDETLNGSY